MKFSNFKMIGEVPGAFGNTEFAEVDVTTTKWLRSTTQRKSIFRTEIGLDWRFIDSGEPADWSALDLNRLELAWRAQQEFKKLGGQA